MENFFARDCVRGRVTYAEKAFIIFSNLRWNAVCIVENKLPYANSIEFSVRMSELA